MKNYKRAIYAEVSKAAEACNTEDIINALIKDYKGQYFSLRERNRLIDWCKNQANFKHDYLLDLIERINNYIFEEDEEQKNINKDILKNYLERSVYSSTVQNDINLLYIFENDNSFTSKKVFNWIRTNNPSSNFPHQKVDEFVSSVNNYKDINYASYPYKSKFQENENETEKIDILTLYKIIRIASTVKCVIPYEGLFKQAFLNMLFSKDGLNICGIPIAAGGPYILGLDYGGIALYIDAFDESNSVVEDVSRYVKEANAIVANDKDLMNRFMKDFSTLLSRNISHGRTKILEFLILNDLVKAINIIRTLMFNDEYSPNIVRPIHDVYKKNYTKQFIAKLAKCYKAVKMSNHNSSVPKPLRGKDTLLLRQAWLADAEYIGGDALLAAL